MCMFVWFVRSHVATTTTITTSSTTTSSRRDYVVRFVRTVDNQKTVSIGYHSRTCVCVSHTHTPKNTQHTPTGGTVFSSPNKP